MRLRRGLLIAMSVLVSGGVLPPGPAAAVFAGSDGVIAYTRTDSTGSRDIYTVNPDGTGRKRLTTDGRSTRPRWSRDGQSIAFQRAGSVFVMAGDGSGQRKVVSTAFHPAWSPDGTRLVVGRLAAPGLGDLYRLPVTGGTPTRLTFGADLGCGADSPTWRFGRILYHRLPCNGQGDQIRVLDLRTGSDDALLTADPATGERLFAPDFAADGRILVMACLVALDCVNSDNLAAVNLDGTGLESLTYSCGCEGDPIYRAYVAAPSGGYRVSWTMPGSSSDLVPGDSRGSLADWQPVG